MANSQWLTRHTWTSGTWSGDWRMHCVVAAMLKYWELDPVLEYFSIHKCVEWWLNDRCKRPPSASRRRWKYIWFHNSHCRQSTWDWWYYRLQFHHLYMFRMTIHDEVVASVCFWRATTHSKWIKRPCSTVSDAKELSFRRGNPGRSLWMPFRPRSSQSMSSATILTPRNAATKRRSDCRHNDEFIHAEILIWGSLMECSAYSEYVFIVHVDLAVRLRYCSATT